MRMGACLKASARFRNLPGDIPGTPPAVTRQGLSHNKWKQNTTHTHTKKPLCFSLTIIVPINEDTYRHPFFIWCWSHPREGPVQRALAWKSGHQSLALSLPFFNCLLQGESPSFSGPHSFVLFCF